MGKKSLIKSTAKKKTESKKEGESKTKKATAGTTTKAAAKTSKKAATQAAKPAAKSKPAAKKLSVKELTFLKFEPIGPAPAKIAAPQPAAAAPTAPPLITAKDAAESDRLHALLAKKFSMDEVRDAAKAPAEKPAAPAEAKPAAKRLSLLELISQKFEPIGPVPEKAAAPQPVAAAPTAPPLITTQDAGEADRLHALLAKKFSMDEVKAAAKAPAEKPTEAPKVKPASKKLSVKELTFLKFEPIGPAPAKMASPQPAAPAPTAPPLITAQDAAEADRLHALLAKKFSMDEVKAAAKAPAEKPAAVPAPEPEAQSEPAQAPVEEAPVAEAPETQAEPEAAPAVESSEPAPQPTPAAPPAPEPQPVLKPAKVVRKTIVTATPAPEPEPAKAPAAAAQNTSESPSDPVVRSAKIAAAAAALVIFILLAVSASNSGKYYIKPIDNAIEIWKGDFSPKDQSFFMVLHGAHAPEPQLPVYSKKEVYPIIFNYYIDKSDTLLDVEGLPDFEGIKKYLNEAQEFAVTSEMKSAVKARLNTIERMVLLYKADVAISRNTENSLESAIEILDEAAKLTSTPAQDEEIAQKIDMARQRIQALKAPVETPAEAPAEPVEAPAEEHAGGEATQEAHHE